MEQDGVVMLVLDGKGFAQFCLVRSMVLWLGILRTGKKAAGVRRTATGNAAITVGFLRSVVERGLRTDRGLLCVIEGLSAHSSRGFSAKSRRRQEP